MPVSTDLNTSPYYDDYNPLKYYYQVLFQPGVSVQTRELNVLQSMLQSQIEMFGDNIFTSGTIVSGCNFQFLNPYPYVQINDLDVFNNATVPQAYFGLNVTNPSGLQATVLNFANGFQSTAPNLKTIYVRYLNTGNTGANLTTFSVGDVLTVTNPVLNPVFQVNVINGGIGFSNANPLVVVPSFIATLTAGSPPANGTYLNNGNGLTNVQIQSISSLGSNQYAIQVAPRSTDLANTQANSLFWTFSVADNLTNPSASLTMTVNQLIGAGLQGNVVTNSVGTVTAIPLINGGSRYTALPWVTIQSFNNSSGYTNLNLSPQNFLTQVVVASGANTVGNGYAFGISNGVIYQKGYFLRVQPQVIIVDPFSQLPDNVAVGFTTTETIVNFNIDQSLLDNANGSFNYQAPGADRLQLVPQLQVLSMANVISNASFLPLVQWNAGNPYIQQQQTIYSTIGAEMAQRTEDVSGDFVLDPFVVTTTTSPNTAQTAAFFNIVSDPGTAYINGYKVQTVANYNTLDRSGTDSFIVNNHAISMNYGNYVTVKNVGGYFPFNTAASVNLYSSATNWSAGSNLNANGNFLGTALMRSMVYYTGIPGTSSEQRQLYLFNVNMNPGASFAQVQTISYNTGAANAGICDVVLQTSANGQPVAALINAANDQMVFYSGVNSLKNANAVQYTYRTVNTALTSSNGNLANATIVIDISSTPETFPYGSGALSSSQLSDFYIVPTGGDMLYKTAISGTVSTSPGSTTVNGTSTGFTSNISVGQWVYVTANTTGGHDLRQVAGIVNNTTLILSSATSFTNTVATIIPVFPNSVPIPFGFGSGVGTFGQLTGNVNINDNIVTLSFGQPFTFSGTQSVSGAFNVSRSNNPSQLTKTANRNVYVSLCTSNNAGGTSGPWCLGVPDIFRLRGVYLGNSSVSNTGTNYVASFFVDPGHNPDYYSLGNLFIQPQANGNLPITGNTYILVNFDYFTSSGSGGYYDTVSYLQTSTANTIFAQDSQNLVSLSAQTYCNSFEVPEIFFDNGEEVDLLSYIDLRPYAANTVNPSGTPTGLPSLNPSNTLTLSTTGEKKFPLPGSIFQATIEGWIGRIDSFYLDQTGKFTVASGNASANITLATPPIQPVGTLKLVDMVVPAYPTLSQNPGALQSQILTTNIFNNQQLKTSRIADHTVYNLSANSSLPFNQPKVYTQAMIGALDAQIQQLFYYTSLSRLEANAASQAIPSSANNGQNRTAYGIFVDDFTTSQFSNLSDPAYAAIQQEGNLYPDKFLWDLQLYGIGSTPYINYPILNQDVATVGGIRDPLGLGPRCALNLANTVAYTLAFRNADDILQTSNPNGLTDTVNLQFASAAEVIGSFSTNSGSIVQAILNTYANAGAVSQTGSGFSALTTFQTLVGEGLQFLNYTYDPNSQTLAFNFWIPAALHGGEAFPWSFYVYGIAPNIAGLFALAFTGQISWQQFAASLNINGILPAGGQFVNTIYYPPVSFYFYNYTQGTAYNIFQNGTLIASTNPGLGVPSAQNLTAADITLLESQAAEYWFNDHPELFMKNFVQGSGGYVTYAGKVVFNYNPNNGSNFTIQSTSLPTADQWRWVMAYPISGTSVGCVPPTPTVTLTGSVTPIFSTYYDLASCGNGASTPGQISVLTGFTAQWNGAIPTPTTSIIPFDASADWQA